MQQHLISGERFGEPSAEMMPVYDPANGEIVEETVLGNAEDVEYVVSAAAGADPDGRWAEDGKLRSRILADWADRIEAATEELALLLTRENGKPLVHSRQELGAGVDTLRFAAGQSRTLEGRSLTLAPGVYGQVVLEPVGVVAVIVPWNWPVLLALRELGPILAAGNTTIVKPAPEAPLTLMRILELALDVPGLPQGVINGILGSGSVVGDGLVSHPRVHMVSFTGSVETGKQIMRTAAEHVKKVVLELGGKSPSVIFEDADLERALPVLGRYMFSTAGQHCMAATRIIVQDSVYEEVRTRLAETARQIKVGPGTDPASEMGPVISEPHLKNIHTLVQKGIASGGELLAGGEQLTGGSLRDGNFYSPTLLAGMPLDSPAVQQEIFGPVVSLENFSDEKEACSLANGTSYGLVGSIWTSDHDRAERVARRIDAGTVWRNTYLQTAPEAESGGMKQSGLGRSRGRFGIYEYLEPKHIVSEVTIRKGV